MRAYIGLSFELSQESREDRMALALASSFVSLDKLSCALQLGKALQLDMLCCSIASCTS